MKGGGALATWTFSAMFLAVFVYLFSFPIAVWITVKSRSPHHLEPIVKFYGPAVWLALRCQPYRKILEDEDSRLGGGRPGSIYLFADPW